MNMKSGIPWSVKGIEPDVREAAKDAARRSGLTLGEWLNAAIIERAETTPVQPSRFIHPRVRERLDSITDELAMMTAERPLGTHARHVESLAPQKEFRIDYNAVIDRIENGERYVSEALASVNDRLQSLKQQIVELAGATTRASDDGGYTALEAALRNIVGHLEISERRTHEALRSVESQVAVLARAEPAEPGFHRDEAEERFQQAENRIAEIAGKLDALARDRSRANQDALQQSVEKLADRIEWVHRTADTTAQRARDGAIASTQSELGKLEEQIRSIAVVAQASAKHSSASQAEIARLRADIESLNQRIDDIRTEAAAERDLHSVRLTIEQLSTRVAQMPEQRSFGDLERRVSELSQRLSELRPPEEVLPQITDIEQRVYELEGRLAEGIGSGPEQAGLDAVQQQIDQMNARLGATEDRMSAIGAIERSISQLFRALEDHREDAHDIAEDAARRAAQDFLQREAQPAGPSPELVALEEALAAVKDHAARSDQQTQETLQAVHETLEEIVNKLADLEAGQQAVLEQRHEAGPGSTAKHDARPSGSEFDRTGTGSEAPAWQSAVQHLAGQQRASAPEKLPQAAQQEPEAADSSAAMDFFVEPQAGIVEFQNLHAPQHSHAPASDDDYIAAARRAAQAAAQGARLGMGKLPYGEQNGTKLATKARRGFSFSLLRRAPALKPRHPPGVSETVAVAADTAAMPQDRGRKRLLLAALLLLAAVSGVALRNSFNEPAPIVHQSEPAKPSPTAGAGKGAALPSDPLSSLIDPLATGSLGKDVRRAITEHQNQNNDVLLADTAPLEPAIAPESVRLAAMGGDAEAQFVIGGRFLDGTGVAQDFTQAAKWYHRAALQGLAPAQYRLATLFERGSGVQQDKKEARTWYQRAALKGNVKAMHNLGVLLAGLTPPDYAHAAHWFRQAAEYGVQDSQYNLALLEERGLGLSEDASEAYFWFSVAAEAGDKDARSRAQLLEESLPLALKSTVRQRLKTFKPKSPEKSANVVPLSDRWTAGDRSPGLM
jgi:localization factor PodJL